MKATTMNRGNRRYKQSINCDCFVAPVVFCLDDVQNYDKLSFKILKRAFKAYERIIMLCLLRDQY